MTIERYPVTSASRLLVADRGLRNTLPPSVDPFADCVELMEVVEALCPEEEEREAIGMRWIYRVLSDVGVGRRMNMIAFS